MAALITQTELDGFNTMGDVMAWAQVDGDADDQSTELGAFCVATEAAVGTPPCIFGVVMEADFNAVANAAHLRTRWLLR